MVEFSSPTPVDSVLVLAIGRGSIGPFASPGVIAARDLVSLPYSFP